MREFFIPSRLIGIQALVRESSPNKRSIPAIPGQYHLELTETKLSDSSLSSLEMDG